MAKKYLDTTGLTRLWEKITGNFATQTDLSDLGTEVVDINSRVVNLRTEVDQLASIGDVNDLETDEKSIIGGINEVHSELNDLNESYLNHTALSSFKIEAIEGNIGTLSNLSTAEQDNLVGAINEVYDDISNQGIEIQNLGIDLTREDNLIRESIGTLSNLTTTEQSSLVGAINEINTKSYDVTRLTLTSDFSVATSSFTPIKYTTKTIMTGDDIVNVNSSGSIAITKPGTYLIQPSVAFNANTSGSRYHDIYDQLYGMANAASSGPGASGVRTCFASACILIITDEMITNGTNTFAHRAYQTSGSALSLAVSGTFVNIVKLNSSLYDNGDEVSY